MDIGELDINQAHFSISQERLEKTARYFHQRDKKLSIGSELLLKYVLNQIGILDPVFSRDEYGKPFLKNYSQVHFNLSHSEKYVACAVSDSPVGVDIERIHDVDLTIAQHYFFGSEYHQIQNSTNKQRTFFEFWVLKESYMKMTGRGFRLALDEFSIDIYHSSPDNSTGIRVLNNKENSIRLQSAENLPEFGLWSVGGKEYMLAVCSESRINPPDLISLEDLEKENILERLF
jgi:4'-phosphopantetheinyl transferase